MILFSNLAYASESLSVMNAYTTEDLVTVFLKDQGEPVDHVYIGNEECTDYFIQEVGPVRTVIIVDNSLSIQEKYRSDIKEFLIDLVAARNDGDLFTIATFSEDVNYLVQESNDYLDIKNKIKELNFMNQDSYFTKTLYQVMDEVGTSKEIYYTRLIVIADGADDESLGYTDNELHKRIQSVKVPIYTIGCTTANNSENLKRMFALSRISNGRNYLIDDTGLSDIFQDILNDNNIIRVDLTPPGELCDGTYKSVRINSGDQYCITELMMPFKAAVSKVASEHTEQVEQTVEPSSMEFMEDKTVPETNIQIPWGPIAVIVIFVSIIFATLMMYLKKNKKIPLDYKEVDISAIGQFQNIPVVQKKQSTDTELLDIKRMGEKNATEIFTDGQSMKLCLQDLQDSSKTFEYPVRDRVLIGKDRTRCQIVVNYNKYISAVHCEVIAKEHGFVVRDGGGNVSASTNGTFVDEKKAAPELPLPAGSVLRLGAVKFMVTYK